MSHPTAQKDYFNTIHLDDHVKTLLNTYIDEYDKKLQRSGNDGHLTKIANTIIRILSATDELTKRKISDAFFQATCAPNFKDLPLSPSTKNKCLVGLAAGFALLAASVLALAVNPVLTIAVAAVAVGILLTSTAVLLNGGPIPNFRSEVEPIFELAMRAKSA